MSTGFRKSRLWVLPAAALMLGLALPAFAQDIQPDANPSDEPRTITVNGQGQAFGAPDIAYVVVGVEQRDADARVAFDAANTAIANVQTALTELGIAPEDIQTTGLNMYLQDAYGMGMASSPDSEENINSRVFVAQNSLSITVRDVEQVGGVIGTALDAGANSIGGLSFGVANRTALEQTAREIALADAQQRATEIATLLGVTVGEPLIVIEQPGNGVYPTAQSGYMGMGGAMSDVSVSTGQLSLNLQVQITYAIAGAE